MSDSRQRYHEATRLFREQARAQGRDLGPHPATPEQIAAAERTLGAPLPQSFRRFQLEFGDCRHGPLDISSVVPADPPARDLVSFNIEERTAGGPKLPPHLIAFSDDGGGDLYCFDSRAFDGGECPVVLWNHELDESQTPELLAPSFADWLHAELEERAAEERESQSYRDQGRLTVMRSFARDVLREWLRRRGDK